MKFPSFFLSKPEKICISAFAKKCLKFYNKVLPFFFHNSYNLSRRTNSTLLRTSPNMLTTDQILQQGRYRIVSQLGQNGIGFGYEAFDKNLGASVLLKEIQ